MPKADYAPITVLIVEDVGAVRLCLRALLRKLGIQNIKEAEDGVAALEILKAEKIDLILSDLRMPSMDGIDLTRILRLAGNSLNSNVPILMISGHSDQSVVKNALRAGVTDFMPKPITPEALASRLKTIFDNAKFALAMSGVSSR
jgi:two-component system chemotaxis response regulator CheY